MSTVLAIAFENGPLHSLYARNLSKWGWVVIPAQTHARALEAAAIPPHAMLMDATWPAVFIAAVGRTLRQKNPSAPILLVGPWCNDDVRDVAEDLGMVVLTSMSDATPAAIHSRLSARGGIGTGPTNRPGAQAR